MHSKKIVCFLIFYIQAIYCSTQVFTYKTTELSNWNGASTYSDIWGYAANGREYAILGSATAITFFEVTNPSSPRLIKQFGPYPSTSWREFKTYSHYAYAVSENSDNGGLKIFDLQYLPDSVRFVRQTNAFFGTCHMPFIDETNGRLYCGGTNTRSNGIIVLDLTTRPDSPSLVINQALPGGYIHDMYVRNNIMYASHINLGSLSIYNCTGGTCSSELARYTTGGLNHSSWINPAGNLLVNAVETGGHPLYLIPLSGPTAFNTNDIKRFKSKTLREQYLAGNAADTFSIGHNPYFVGNLIFVSYYTDGVQVFDASNPSDIRRIAYFDTDRSSTSYSPAFRGCWGVYPFLPSGAILASDIQTGMWIFRVNNSALPLKQISLDGKPDGKYKIKLHATVTPTSPSSKLVLEKSENGIEFYQFQNLQIIDAEKVLDKTIIDRQPLKLNYYRLKFVHADGEVEYSPIVKIKIEEDDFILYPNPIRDRINFYSPEKIANLQISDKLGRIVLVIKDPYSGIYIPDYLPAGHYVLKALGEGKVYLRKFIIQK